MINHINEFLKETDEIMSMLFDAELDFEEITNRYTQAKMFLLSVTDKVTSLEVVNEAENSMPKGSVMRVPSKSFTHLEIKLEDGGKKVKIVLL